MLARVAPHELAEADREQQSYEERFDDIWSQPGLFSSEFPELAKEFCDEVMVLVHAGDNDPDVRTRAAILGSKIIDLREKYVQRAAEL